MIAPMSSTAPVPSPPALPPAPFAGQVLLLEDDPAIAQTVSFVLEREGYRVVAVEDGPAAVQTIEQRLPTLVLLDLMLPGMDGAEVLRRIRARADRDTLPVIVLSGDVLSGRSTELRALDVNGIIAKPVDLEELLNAIGFCLEARPAG